MRKNKNKGKIQEKIILKKQKLQEKIASNKVVVKIQSNKILKLDKTKLEFQIIDGENPQKNNLASP